MDEPHLLPGVVALVAVLLASITDLSCYRIPNGLSLPLLCSGVLYQGAVAGRVGLLSSLLGVLFGGGILFLLHLRGGIGGGDVKLLAGVGAWLGIGATILAFIGMGLAAGIYVVSVIMRTSGSIEVTRLLKPLAENECVEQQVHSTDPSRRIIPFAPMIAIGVLFALVWSWVHPGH